MAHGISQEKLDEIGLEPEQVNGKEFLAPVYRNTYLGFLYKKNALKGKWGSAKFLIIFKFQSTL